jgi:hypothetical protein
MLVGIAGGTMRISRLLSIVGILLAAAAAQAEAAVMVTFVDAAHYTNAALYGGSGAAANEPALEQIRAELQLLGARYLKPGRTLRSKCWMSTSPAVLNPGVSPDIMMSGSCATSTRHESG